MSLNVLVVDDSDVIRRMIIKTLALSQVDIGRTYEARDGREALEFLQDEWVDVVIADLNMPIMGGMELLRAMRASDELRGLPVIVVSAESAATRVSALKDLGVATFVRKPFTPEEIRDALYSLDGLSATRNHVALIGESAAIVLERFAMLIAEPSQESLSAGSDSTLCSVLRFSGAMTGSITVAAPQSLCENIARTALGVDEKVGVSEGADALGEFTNMLVGVLGTTLDTAMQTNLTPPEVSRMTPEQWTILAGQSNIAQLSVDGAPLLISLRMRGEL